MAWSATRLSEAGKRRLVDYFVLGVPAYRLRFHGLASSPTVERFYRVMRQVVAIAEESTAPLAQVSYPATRASRKQIFR